MFTKLWRRAAGRTHRPSPGRGQPRSRRLGFEHLEDRSLPCQRGHRLERAPAPVPAQPAGPRPHGPQHGPRPRGHVRRRQRHRPVLRAVRRRRPRLARRLAGGGRRPGGPRHPGRPVPVPRRPSSTPSWPRTWRASPPGLARQGVAIGQEVARQILALRADDGSVAGHDLDAAEQRPGHVPADPAELRPGRQRARPVHHPVRDREQLPVPPRPAPGPGQPGVRGRLSTRSRWSGRPTPTSRAWTGTATACRTGPRTRPWWPSCGGRRWATTRSGTGSPRTRPRPTT